MEDSAPHILDTAAILLTLTAVFSWINARYLRLPHSVALVLAGLAVSVVLVLSGWALPGLGLADALRDGIQQIDFSRTLLDGMLAFMLFAGGMQIDFDEMRGRRVTIGILAVAGTLISVAAIGAAFWGVAMLFGIDLPLIWALVFAALISPTDPVAVLVTLRNSRLPSRIKIVMQGESLFNDGVGIVLFAAFIQIADGDASLGIGDILLDMVVETGGGIALGAAAGYLTYLAIRAIDEHAITVLLTIALVSAAYALAHHIHVSGPIAMVVAGLLIGNRGANRGMSEQTRRYVDSFWVLVGEILDSLLFFLVGLEVLLIHLDYAHIGLTLLAIPIAVGARVLSIALALPASGHWRGIRASSVTLMTWGGVRGGISIALALSIQDETFRPLILSATYAVVLFTIVGFGLTISGVARRLYPEEPKDHS